MMTRALAGVRRLVEWFHCRFSRSHSGGILQTLEVRGREKGSVDVSHAAFLSSLVEGVRSSVESKQHRVLGRGGRTCV